MADDTTLSSEQGMTEASSSEVVVAPVKTSADMMPGESAALSSNAPSWMEQDEILRELWQQNLSPVEIAERLHRSVAAIMTRSARLGLPRRFAPGRKAGQRYPRRTPAPAPFQKRMRGRERIGQEALYGAAERPVQTSERICLMCLRKFQSEGSHNRICESCKKSAEYDAGSRIPDITFGAGS